MILNNRQFQGYLLLDRMLSESRSVMWSQLHDLEQTLKANFCTFSKCLIEFHCVCLYSSIYSNVSQVYSLKIPLPYHILLLLLIAENPEVCNSNLIGCKFLFAGSPEYSNIATKEVTIKGQHDVSICAR